MEKFASSVLNRLSTNFGGLREYKKIIPVGGGSVFLHSVMNTENLHGRVLNINKSKFACEILPTQINAVGGLRIEGAKLK